MSLRDAFEEQRRMVDDLILRPVQAVRARGEARRRRRTVTAAAAVLAVAGAVGVAVPRLRPDAPVPPTAAAPTCGGTPATEGAAPPDYPTSRHVRIFLRSDATADEISAVEDTLKAAPAVESYAYEGKEEALAKFRELYACTPDVLAHTRPEDLPPSFDVMLRAAAGYPAFAAAVKAEPGVEMVLRVQE